MKRTYNITSGVQDWLKSHADDLYNDVLEAAELFALTDQEGVTVCTIRSITGVTNYVLTDPHRVAESLQKAEMHYVEREEYEKAGRARDCGKLWKDKALIYRKSNHH